MAVATATALRGQVRSQRRAWTLSRGCWRLVVLLGFAWAALVLLGGTAEAAPSDARNDRPAPATPGSIPLLGQTLTNVGTLVGDVTAGLTGAGGTAVPKPVAQVAETATKAVADVSATVADTASTVAADAPAYLPAVEGLEAVEGLADSFRETAESTASEQQLLDLTVPALASTIAPAVAAAAEQVDASAQLVKDAAAVLTSPLPVAQPLQSALAPLVGAVDRVTDVVTATTTFATSAADGVVAMTTQALAPMLAVVTAPAGSIAVTAAGGAGPSGPGVPAAQPGLETVGTGPVGADTGLAIDTFPHADSPLPESAHGSPAVPPPDAHTPASDVAQSAPDITTALPVPVSGAGSTTGNGGSVPTPVLDQTLVRVESAPQFAANANDPIEGPTGPMPGTPCADPTFSPD